MQIRCNRATGTKLAAPGSERRSAIRKSSPPWRTPLLFPRSFSYGERSFRLARTTRSCPHENDRGTTLKSKFRCPEGRRQRCAGEKVSQKADARGVEIERAAIPKTHTAATR